MAEDLNAVSSASTSGEQKVDDAPVCRVYVSAGQGFLLQSFESERGFRFDTSGSLVNNNFFFVCSKERYFLCLIWICFPVFKIGIFQAG